MKEKEISMKVRFTGREQAEFFATTRKRVDAYFTEKAISKHANGAMWAKITFFMAGFISLYVLILSNRFEPLTMLGLAVLLGMFGAFIGFNVSHDAMHGSLSANGRINDLVGASFYMLGANPYVWKITHNVIHHTYTNIPGHDEDLEVAPGLIRICPDEEVNKIQRYQHWYAFLLYGLASLSWVLRKDYKKFFQKKIGQIDNSRHPRKEYFNLFFYKAVYYFFFLVLPFIVLDITWWQLLLGFIAGHLAQGLVLGLVFQLAHVVEDMDFPVPNEQGTIEENWAVHQMHTTANFARNSPIVNFLCGGLNMQIEHHLFPKVCHIHYPAISEIVKSTAEEFGVPYIEKVSFLSALQSHYRMLRKLGRGAYDQKRRVDEMILQEV
ncbi:MAG: acyl-CoA desaturase [Cytophagaceae bacterium]|nr:acyl-CoA desaturase [Cytophagaceae bacterium]